MYKLFWQSVDGSDQTRIFKNIASLVSFVAEKEIPVEGSLVWFNETFSQPLESLLQAYSDIDRLSIFLV